MNQQSNYKLIVAIKAEPLIQPLYAILRYDDKLKRTDLPTSEGQFFDLNHIQIDSSSQLQVTIHSHTQIGEFNVPFPSSIQNNVETEISDIVKFDLPKSKKHLKIKYYIIVLNKQIFKQQNQNSLLRPKSGNTSRFFTTDDNRSQSPSTKNYIKSQKEHEDSHYNQSMSKKILSQKNKKDLNKSDIIQDRSILNETYAKYSEKSPKLQRQLKELQDENEFQRKQILTLETQIKCPQQGEDLVNALKESNQQRDQLHLDILRKGDEIKKMNEQYQLMFEDLKQEKIEQNHENNKLQDKINQLMIQIEELKLQLQQKNNLVGDLKEKNGMIDEFAKLCSDQQQKLEVQDKKLKELFSYRGEDEKLKQKQKANKDRQLQEQINKIRIDLLKEQQKNQSLQGNLEGTLNKLKLQTNQISSNKQLADQNDRLKEQNDNLREQNEHLESIIENLREQIQKLEDKPIFTEDDRLKQQISDLEKQLKQNDLEIGERNAKILMLKGEIENLKFKINTLNVGCDDSSYKNRDLLAENNHLLKTINDLTKQLQYINKQLLEARLTAKDYELESQEKDAYLNSLKHLILQLEERGVVYNPNGTDKIDNALANYLNNHNEMEMLRNLFIRESEGVYQFGCKKIYIKVQQDKIKIRSGGGYISIEEFLQMYSQTEMDKQYKADPLQKLSKNQALYKKMDEMKQVNMMKTDSMSPIKKSTKF